MTPVQPTQDIRSCLANLPIAGGEGFHEEHGEAFLAALRQCDEHAAEDVLNYAEHTVTNRQSDIFANQKTFVFGAYAVIWAALIIGLLVVWWRQQSLKQHVAELTRKLDKPPEPLEP